MATHVLLLACAALVLATGQAAAAQVDSGALIARVTERPWGLGFDRRSGVLCASFTARRGRLGVGGC